ncbi:hydrolase [Psychromonas marina]|uniref:Hydrolase n=1 Tax=Psychromonas marina TaxID=88364 RepID=A0ABQ6DZ23_9GAMM|nr:linear amide C-N hydrolase [Psychromonas marina]GLS90233.1 hydrolase [Psychromonas marina]
MRNRIMYKTAAEQFITGRSMDCQDPSATTRIMVYPRGLAQNGGSMENALTWTAKYGSIFSSFYDGATADGMNECGFVANILKCAESDFGDVTLSDKPRLSLTAWSQYFLDNFSTVEEALVAMQDPGFVIHSPVLPNGKKATVYLAISDTGGNAAVLEYVQGNLVIQQERRAVNSATAVDKLNAIDKYWELAGSEEVKGVDFPLSIKKPDDFSIMRAIGRAQRWTDPDHPSISATLRYTQVDHAAKRYYFESTFETAVCWLDMESVNIEAGASLMGVEIKQGESLVGDISSKLVPMKQLNWL